MFHTHGNVKTKIEYLRLREIIKEKALRTTERANDIAIREISKIDNDELIEYMPNLSTICDSIKRHRNTKDGLVPGRAEDIPDQLKRDTRGDDFFRFDTGVGTVGRFVVFFSKLKMEYAKHIDIVLIDGTFKSTPSGFYQILVIHGMIFESFYPLGYVLLSNKCQDSYRNGLHKFNELFKINPKFIVTDFERGLMNAVSEVFDADYHGCLFHFGQAIWKRIQSERLVSVYKRDGEFKKYVGYLSLLAFVPVSNVRDFYLMIKKKIIEENINEIVKFWEYFEKVWVGVFDLEDEEKIVSEPLYAIEFWNTFERVKNDIPRTSNAAEAWNRVLNFRSEVAHPNIAQFINELNTQEEAHRFNIKRGEQGKFKFSREDLVKERKLYTIVKNFKIFEPWKYLELLADNYKFKMESEDNDGD